MDNNFYNRLKTITKPLHDEIEHSTLAKLVASGQADKRQYALFLHKLSYFIRNCADGAEVFDELCLKENISNKLIRIKDDIDFLGVHFVDEQTWEIKKVGNKSDALGVMYVLEGSMIGASIQAPIIAKSLGLDGASGMSYMTNGGINPMQSFPKFIKLLNDNVCTEDEQKRCILSASDAFLSLKILFDSL